MAALGSGRGHSGATKPSVLEQETYEADLFAKRFTSIPTNMQLLLKYDGDGNVEYIGQAARGLAEGGEGWLLWKFTWDSGNLTSRKVAYGTWTGRETATYE